MGCRHNSFSELYPDYQFKWNEQMSGEIEQLDGRPYDFTSADGWRIDSKALTRVFICCALAR